MINSKKSAANDLFLLMLNLSQMAKKENIIEVFIGALNAIWPTIEVKYLKSQPENENNLIQISTGESIYGYLRIDNLVKLDTEDESLLYNACGMLAVVLKKAEQELLLVDEKLLLQKRVQERTQHLSKEIKERKKVEKELKRSEENYRFLVDNQNDLIVKMNAQQQLTFISPNYCQTFGVNDKDIIGKSFFPLIHKNDVENVEISLANLKNPPYKTYHEERAKTVIGWRWFGWSLRAFVDDKGNILETLAVGRDITERRKAEEELIAAKDKAEESDRLKSAFLTNMSHEIRTPMNGILGFTGLLKEADLTGTEREKYIDIIEKSGARMLNTINDIIDFSRIESGEVEAKIMPTNINSQMESLYDFFQPEAEKNNIKLSYKPGLDNTSSDIQTDHNKIDAILTNLIKNAIKFTHKGFIEFGYTPVDKEIQFYVKDTGVGIKSDNIESIFERFIQEEMSDIRTHQGSGLGLPIVKAYVELLGGKIWVESKKGEGSTFYFTIPYKTIQEGTTTKELNNKGTMDKKNVLANKTILIVEDDEISFEHLKITNKSFGFNTIIWAKNGEEAIELCKENSNIDIVLMDINMPLINGYEATKAIKKLKPNLPIIAQTAYAFSGDREKALEAGCNDYITKPIKKEELLEKIENIFLILNAISNE